MPRIRWIKLVVAICISTLSSTDCLECYSCTNIEDVNSCRNTTQCQFGQACFLELKHVAQTAVYTLGCRDNQYCVNPAVGGSAGLVGRDIHVRQIHDCFECCNTENCNKHLCEHPKPSACIDDPKADCPWLNTVFNICNDTHHAKTECPKFCGLCTLVDGNWAAWTTWSQCDVTCENGTQVRKRSCTNPAPADGGLDCLGDSIEKKVCVKQLCPVHGGWSKWSNWESCSVTCDIGIQRRHRNCSNPYPDRFGDHCFGESMDDKICTPGPCANGGWSPWDVWGTCSKTCGVGLQSRYRTCTNPYPSTLGQSCAGNNVHVQTCNTQSCQKDPVIAFESSKLENETLKEGEVYVFTITLMNIGDGYDNLTGIFTAPVTGLYSFSTQHCLSYSRNSSSSIFSFVVNNKEIKNIMFENSEHVSCGTFDALTHLKKGDRFWIKCTSESSLYEDLVRWNTFSGFLIHT
ncbi:hemicentin-1-like isoform X1 [Ruditapes philippinarum]|uniref:hemicentin-1-like isoform X1 n=1 Tax=Ruditapes philippinarum TaxID=129788 RepID=UPI00295AADEF|nr:hemicentin-1-like isoform X1 [Ruditapes philippinarum]